MRRIKNEWRCRFSELGLRVDGRKPEARGTAWIHAGDPGYTRVQWDGRKEPRTYLAVDIEECDD